MTEPRPSADTLARLLSLTAHELRAPASVVAGYLQMLSGPRGASLSDDQRHLVELARKSGARLLELLDELSQLARLEEGRTTLTRIPTSLRALVDRTLDRHGARDRGVRVEVSHLDAKLLVLADPEQLFTALLALVDAVARETGDGASILVVGKIPPTAAAASGQAGSGGTIGIEIVEARFGATLLEGDTSALRPLDETRGGLGLRLAIARRLIERHEGRVWSSADGDRVSGIALTLPAAPPA